ncbi:MAG: hypothetical protein N4A32_03690 [Marinifilaceae bacterium]|jgi:hypothetical protein|nr:hypothetical protein [Marinifilaceae bacterium]
MIEDIIIKVPVYSSTPIENSDKNLFGEIDFHKMENSIVELINNYTKDSVRKFRNGTRQETVIKSITYSLMKREDRNWILLKISAYETNYVDGYVVTKSKHDLEPDDKIGKDSYFILLVPNIIGYENKKSQWVFFIYDDPNKESKEIIRISKLVITKVLKQTIFNIKLEAILSNISKLKKIPELNITFNSLSHDGKVDEKYKKYLSCSNLKKHKEVKFSQFPSNMVEDIIFNHKYEKDYQKREVKLKLGEREYRIIREEAQKKIKNTIEEVYNCQIKITKKEFTCKVKNKPKIYDSSFILEKLSPIVHKYFE